VGEPFESVSALNRDMGDDHRRGERVIWSALVSEWLGNIEKKGKKRSRAQLAPRREV